MLYKICDEKKELYVLGFGKTKFNFTKNKKDAVQYGLSFSNSIADYLNHNNVFRKKWVVEGV